MATLQVSSSSSSSCSSSRSLSFCNRRFIALHAPKSRTSHLSLPKLPTVTTRELNTPTESIRMKKPAIESDHDSDSTAKLYALAEIVADRAEMHANIGEQRNNWNSLLLNSINAITLAAATMAGLAANSTGTPLVAFKLSSTLLYSAATGMLLIMNKIQPSQLAEEQRNAARLLRNLHTQIHTTLALRTPTPLDVKDAMERVLALDKAYPLPLLPGMLEKFPMNVEPAVWWPSMYHSPPRQVHYHHLQQQISGQSNGWSENLEEEMRGVLGLLKRKDTAEYIRLSKVVLKVNRILAISGPLLTGIAALASALVGLRWAVLVGVAGGALASVVNTLEHGGQVGMVFEMYRNSAGYYRLMEETIEWTLKEKEMGKRENGVLFEMTVALQLGRSVSEVRNLALLSSTNKEEFAGQLF